MEDSVFSNALQGTTVTDEEACKKQNNEKGENVKEAGLLTGYFSFLLFEITIFIESLLVNISLKK